MWALLWSHSRDIRVKLLEKTIKYSIPIYSEDGMIGKMLKTKIEHGTLDITFERIDKPTDTVKKPFLDVKYNEDPLSI
jgi:hypothetical protein